MPPARPASSLFRNPSADQSPPQSLYSPPPTNISSNGLFSPSPTSAAKDRFASKGGNSLFAGATPGAKSGSSRFASNTTGGGSRLFGSGAPSFAPPAPALTFNAQSSPESPNPPRPSSDNAIVKSSRRGSASKRSRFLSPTDGDDEEEAVSPRIFEDDSRGDPTPQDEDSMELADETTFDDTMNDESSGFKGPEMYKEGIIDNAIHEPGALIIRAEELMEELNNLIAPRAPLVDANDSYDEDMDLDRPVPPSIESQQEFLARFSKMFLGALEGSLERRGTSLHKAFTVASLVLALHHSTANTAEVLRKWLYTYLPKPTRQELQTLKMYTPNCVCAREFWEIVQGLTLRGEVQEAVTLLRNADWDVLSTEAPRPPPKLFGGDQPAPFKRYSPEEIETIKEAAATAIHVLSATPGRGRSSYQPSSSQFFPNPSASVDAGGSAADWRIWRGSVIKAFEELKALFAGTDATNLDDETDDSFSFYNNHQPGGGGYGFGYASSQRTKKAKLPADIYHSFRYIYDVLRGDPDTVTQISDRWEEAVVGLMMWARVEHDEIGDELDDEDLDLDMSTLEEPEYRRLVSSRKNRELDRLKRIVEDTVINGDLPMNSTEPVDVAAVGVMAGDLTFLLELCDLSLLVASVITEVGSLAGWVPRESSKKKLGSASFLDNFDEEEQAVLGHVKPEVDRDATRAEDVLRKYASALFGLPWVDEDAEVEGWQIGVGLFARVHKGRELSGRLLTQLPLTSKNRVEGLLTYCAENNLPETASKIAFTYAETLNKTTNYGDTLHFYALANSQEQMHGIVTKLISHTLTASAPFPPTADLDPTLKNFLTSPDAATTDLLRFELSGYAALRMYFDNLESQPKIAAKALAATIRGAGEKLDGGVYDEQWCAAMEPWCLPCLFAGVLPLIRILEMPDLFDVLKVVGDWEEMREDSAVVQKAREVWEESRRKVDGSWVNVPGGAGNDEWRRVESVVRVLRLEAGKVIAKAWLTGA